MVVGARQNFQISLENIWFLENNRGLFKYLYRILYRILKLIFIMKSNVVELFHQKLTTKRCEASGAKEKNTVTLISYMK